MKSYKTDKISLKAIQAIYAALIVGVVIAIVVFYFSVEQTIFVIDAANSKTILVPVGAFFGLAINNFFFNRTVNAIDKDVDLQVKLAQYQTANILRAALLEGPAFFAIFTFSNTGNIYFLMFAIALIIVMAFHFPTKEKFIDAFDLSFKEKSKLEH
ncbi:hypothetical protein KH5_20630 [Urechidicola sp. KH5]